MSSANLTAETKQHMEDILARGGPKLLGHLMFFVGGWDLMAEEIELQGLSMPDFARYIIPYRRQAIFVFCYSPIPNNLAGC